MCARLAGDRAARRDAGEHGLFVDGAGASVFAAPIEAYMGGVRAKLVQWTDRLLAEARARGGPRLF